MAGFTSRSELKDQAKGSMTGNYINSAIMLIFYYFISLIAERALGSSAFLSVLLSIATAMLSFGMHFFFLKVALNQRAVPIDIFYGFLEVPQKTGILASINTALSIIMCAPLNLIARMYFSQTGITTSNLRLLLSVQGVLFILWIPIHLCLSQMYFLLLDFPEYSVKEILVLSYKKMKGQKIRFLLFEISFLPLFLLTIPTFGLGLIWLLPYFFTAKAHFYLDLMRS